MDDDALAAVLCSLIDAARSIASQPISARDDDNAVDAETRDAAREFLRSSWKIDLVDVLNGAEGGPAPPEPE